MIATRGGGSVNRSCSILARPAVAIVACFVCLIGSARAAEGTRPLGLSELPIEQQRQIEQRVAPPPTAERDAPYSTPMYYLMHKGFSDGPHGELLLDRNRPDWQEALIRDWSELGLTSTQALTTPKQWDDPSIAQAYRDYFRRLREDKWASDDNGGASR